MHWIALGVALTCAVGCAPARQLPPVAKNEEPRVLAAPDASLSRVSKAPDASAPEVAAKEKAPAPAPDDGVPRCEGSQTFLASEFYGDDSARIVELELNGERVKTWLEQNERIHPAIDVDAKLAVGVAGLTDLASGRVTPLVPAKRWEFPVFVRGKPWVASSIITQAASDEQRIEIFDYRKNGLVASIVGTGLSIGPAGEILFLVSFPQAIDVKRFEAGRSRQLKRIALADHGVQDVYALTALGGDKFVYGVVDDHEHRYYFANDEPFFPGAEGHWIDFKNKSRNAGPNKEQYGLTLSANGKWAAFTERNWNELTYLVIVDRKTAKRQQLPFYGDLPCWTGDTLVFVSDPTLIRTQNPQFRQMEHVLLYAYDARSGALCKIAAEDGVLPYGPQGP